MFNAIDYLTNVANTDEGRANLIDYCRNACNATGYPMNSVGGEFICKAIARAYEEGVRDILLR